MNTARLLRAMRFSSWLILASTSLLPACGSDPDTVAGAALDSEAPDTADAVILEDSPVGDSATPQAEGGDTARSETPSPAVGDCDPTAPATKPSLLFTEEVGRTGHGLVATTDRLLFVAADWSSGADRVRLLKTEPSAATTLASMPRIDRVETNGTAIVWFEQKEAVWESDFGGAFPRPYTPSHPIGVAIHGPHVFWTEEGLAADNRDGRIKEARLGPPGSSGRVLAVGPAGKAIAADADNVYAVTDYRPSLMPSEHVVVKVPRTGELPTELASRTNSWHQEIALSSGTIVVLLDGPAPEILAVSPNGAVSTLAKPPAGSRPRSLNARGGTAYWAEGSTIRRAPLDGKGPASTFWSGSCEPASVAVNDTAVFWLTTTLGSSARARVWSVKL